MQWLGKLVTYGSICVLLIAFNRPAWAQTCVPITGDNLDQIEPYATFNLEDPVALAWSPDSEKLAISARGEIVLYMPHSEEMQTVIAFEPLMGINGEFLPGSDDVIFSPDGSLLAFTMSDTLSVFDITTAETHVLDDFYDEFLGSASAIAFSADGTKAAITTATAGTVLLIDVQGSFRIAEASSENALNSGNAILFSSDGTIIVDANWETVTFRDALSLDEIAVDVPSDLVVRDLKLTADGRILVGVSNDYYSGRDPSLLTFWDMSTFEEISTIETYPGSISLTFNPNGDVMAMGGAGAVYLWDIRAEAVPEISDSATRILDEHIGDVESITFSPDGRFLASASVDLSAPSDDDGTVIVWGVCS